jgi:hypothetical protein
VTGLRAPALAVRNAPERRRRRPRPANHRRDGTDSEPRGERPLSPISSRTHQDRPQRHARLTFAPIVAEIMMYAIAQKEQLGFDVRTAPLNPHRPCPFSRTPVDHRLPLRAQKAVEECSARTPLAPTAAHDRTLTRPPCLARRVPHVALRRDPERASRRLNPNPPRRR